jgi:hypothetical protein
VDVRKRPSASSIWKAWQMSLATRGVAVAVRQMTRSALISCANRDISAKDQQLSNRVQGT